MGDVISQMPSEDQVPTLLAQELYNLSYDEFLTLLGELNVLAKKCLDSKGYQLLFAVKKDTDSTLFWKATVQIACVKIDTTTQKVLTYRILNLIQFLKVIRTFKSQVLAAEQSKSENPTAFNDLNISTLINETVNYQSTSDSPNECIICFERKQDVTLPCAHSFCTQCIEEWNESNDTCPICRERLESPNDTWVISDFPKAEEISKEMRDNFLELTEESESTCNPS